MMLRNSSKQSHKSYNVSSVLSKLRGSLTQYDNPSTDRISQSRKRYNSSALDVFHKFPPVRSSSEKKRKCVNESRANSLKKLLKSYNSTNVSKNIHSQSKQKKTEKCVIDEQFKQSIKKLDHQKHTHIGGNQCFLDYRNFITIMSQMNYLNNWKQDNLLMDDMWKQLGGQQNGGFLRSNLLLFLYLLQGISEVQHKTLQVVDENSQKDLKRKRIYFKYQKLRLNRMQNKGISSSLNSTSGVRVFKEEDSDNNLKKLRKSLIVKDSNQMKVKKPVKLKKKSEKEQTKQSSKSFRVSFKLDVNSKGNKQNRDSTKQTIQSKQLINYFEENIIQKSSKNKATQHTQSEVINISQQPVEDHQSEIHPITAFDTLDIKPRPKRIALLSLDINLGQGKSDKIIIFEGDTSKQIAEALAIKHQLTKDVCAKFQKILESHLNHILSKIQEVQELTEDLSCSHREV